MHQCTRYQGQVRILGERERDSYGLDDRGSILSRDGDFSLHHVQTGSGDHLGGFLPGGKAAGAWSLPLTSIPDFPIIFIVWFNTGTT
jgi:hypothetical protein